MLSEVPALSALLKFSVQQYIKKKKNAFIDFFTWSEELGRAIHFNNYIKLQKRRSNLSNITNAYESKL